MHTENITHHGARPGSHEDTTPAVRAALAELHGGGILVFPQGTYHFWAERAAEAYLFVSNNDASTKRIAFPLFGVHDVEIDGGGSEFVFHGGVTPFAVWNATNIRIHNFTMDWERTFHSEVEIADVVSAADNRAVVDIRIPAAYPYVVQNERLLFLNEDGKPAPLANALEFDPVRRETAFKVHDNYGLHTTHHARELASGLVRLTAQFGTVPTPGNVLVMVHTGRVCPGFAVSDSRDLVIEDVTIHHAGAMGIVAQRTQNVHLNRVQVVPAAHKGRLVSTTADATHFVNCRGLVEMTDCVFEGQMDDPTNVHGIYVRISRAVSPTQIEVELVHHQQAGLDITQAGDTLEFVHSDDLLTFHHAMVARVERINSRYSLLTMTQTLPDTVKTGDAVASTGWVADVAIRGCTARSNRARGFLLSTPGRVVVENNTFHTPGAAILIAGDANYWFESGAVRDVLIRGNHFDTCNFGVWGRACIDICPEIEPAHRPGTSYHRGIVIDGNTFDAFDLRLLKAHCVDGLTVTNNLVCHSNAYPAPPTPHALFDITDCQGVVETGNILSDTSAEAAIT